MDFSFSPEEKNFQAQVRAFLDQEVSDDFLSELEKRGEVDFSREFTKKLAQKGWLAIAWPKEYGGGGASIMQQLIFNEEIGYHHAPTGAHRQGIKILGPCLMVHGTEEQKRQYLPPITAAEVVWCQGFSEPNAGSDLASLQCRAIADGDDYVITGQKVWTTNAHRADCCHLLARTDPDAAKHRGISYFLVEMKSPGISVRPLINMLAAHDFNEVFFDNVRAPKQNMLGEKNQGWYVSQTALNFERSGIEEVGMARKTLEQLVDNCKETRHNGKPVTNDPIVRHKLAEMAVQIEMARMIAYRVAWLQSKGQIPSYEASMSKLVGTETRKRLGDIGMQVLGLYGSIETGAKWAPLKGRVMRAYLHALGQTMAMGTSEIQRNIIALRGLELPRA